MTSRERKAARVQIAADLRTINSHSVRFILVDAQNTRWNCLNGQIAVTVACRRGPKRRYIAVNSDEWGWSRSRFRKATLLHESGHLNDPDYDSHESLAAEELHAHAWGMERALELGWKDAHRHMQRVLRRCRKYRNDEHNHVYWEAYRLAVRRGLISK